MLFKESYGFNTFAGLRVEEIQRKTDVLYWFHIASHDNIADVLTKGAVPTALKSDSRWQQS